MKEYCISVNGQRVRVTREVYETYYKLERRLRYYEYDIKTERVYKKNGQEMRVPSKEDSFDRLNELGVAPGTEATGVEDEVLRRLTHQQLYLALETLPAEEFRILFEIFWNEKSERELARQSGIPQKTLNDRKKRILQKLCRALEEAGQP